MTAALTLVPMPVLTGPELARVRKRGETHVHYVRAAEYDLPRAKATDDACTALCGEMGGKDERWREVRPSFDAHVCNLCHVRACRQKSPVRSKPSNLERVLVVDAAAAGA